MKVPHSLCKNPAGSGKDFYCYAKHKAQLQDLQLLTIFDKTVNITKQCLPDFS